MFLFCYYNLCENEKIPFTYQKQLRNKKVIIVFELQLVENKFNRF